MLRGAVLFYGASFLFYVDKVRGNYEKQFIILNTINGVNGSELNFIENWTWKTGKYLYFLK